MQSRALASSVMLLLLGFTAGHAATIHVPGDYPTIQAAITASLSGDTILVATGVYHESLSLPHGCVLASESGAAATTIDGDGTRRVIAASTAPGPIEIRGFTIESGFTEGSGGGLELSGVTLRLTECVLRENYSLGFGGAIHATGCQLEITGNTFYANNALEGACAYLRDSGGAIENNVFRDNQGLRHAGGMYLYSSSPVIRHNLFLRCHSGLHGGGLDIAVQSNPEVANNTFIGCSASEGGSIIVANETGVVVVQNNIITGTVNGYGISDHYYPGSLPPSLACNDFWNNSPGDYLAMGPGADDISLDPEFCSPETDVYAIMSSSPCAPAQQPHCGLIGDFDVACGATAVEPATWGRVKALLRR